MREHVRIPGLLGGQVAEHLEGLLVAGQGVFMVADVEKQPRRPPQPRAPKLHRCAGIVSQRPVGKLVADLPEKLDVALVIGHDRSPADNFSKNVPATTSG